MLPNLSKIKKKESELSQNMGQLKTVANCHGLKMIAEDEKMKSKMKNETQKNFVNAMSLSVSTWGQIVPW